MAAWTAVGMAAGSAIGGLMSKSGQSGANRMNLRIARENMGWQERMSNTAHQREVKDLLAAGLNPMLGFTGSGASTPTPPTPTMENENAEFGKGIASAAQALAGAKQLKLLDAQINTQNAVTDKTKAEAAVLSADANFAASNAAFRNSILFDQMQQMVKETSIKEIERLQKGFEYENMTPVAFQLMQIQRDLDKLGIPEKAAQAKMWEQAGASGKWIEAVLDALPNVGITGLFKRAPKKIIGRQRSVTRGKSGSTHEQETYDYER